MEFFAPYAIDDLMHFTRMGSPANVVLPLLMLAAFVGQIFFMLRGGKNSRIVLVKFAFLVLLLSELGRNLDGGGAFLVGIYRLGRGGPHRGRKEEEKVRERPLGNPSGGRGTKGAARRVVVPYGPAGDGGSGRRT